VVAAFWPPGLLEIGLSSSLAALAYLAMEEFLVEAHKEPETLMSTGMFFIGFLVFLLLGMFNH
jgi:ZIP family zinc transporter